MSAQKITVESTETSGCNIVIKLVESYIVPSGIEEDSVQDFRCWEMNDDHLFVWTRPSGTQRRMKVPKEYVGWIIVEQPSGYAGDFFKIDTPCNVTIDVE